MWKHLCSVVSGLQHNSRGRQCRTVTIFTGGSWVLDINVQQVQTLCASIRLKMDWDISGVCSGFAICET